MCIHSPSENCGGLELDVYHCSCEGGIITFVDYCVQRSNRLSNITNGKFYGPSGVAGILAPIRYVHDGCHMHISKFGLMSIGYHLRHTLGHTVCSVQTGFQTSQMANSTDRVVLLAYLHLLDMYMMVATCISLNLAL